MAGRDLSQVKKYQIIPILNCFPSKWNTPAAVNLLAGTYEVESSGIYVQQLNDGPAHGCCEMELITLNDMMNRVLKLPSMAAVAAAINSLTAASPPVYTQLDTNDGLAFAYARVKYITNPAPLPAADDALGLATYHKTWYNTSGGATVLTESVKLFQQAIAA